MLIRNTPALTLAYTYMQRFICSLVALLIILLLTPIISFAQIDTASFEFEGITRDYLVFLPKSYDGVTQMPVVLNLHGYTLDKQQQMNYSQMNLVADTAGFIVVYPNAVNTTWNSGIYDSPEAPPNPNINDIGFIDALIDTLQSHYSIDLEKIYSCGFSNGGFMSFKLACQLSNRIAAIASVEGAISNTTASECNCNHTMPVLIIHGTADNIVHYNGDAGWHSVEYTLDYWKNFNSCIESDTTSLPDLDTLDGCTVERINYTDSFDSIKVVFYKVINGGHTWPGGDKQYLVLSWGDIGKTNGDFNASVEIWNFLKTYKLSDPTTVTTHSQHPIEFSLFQNYPNPFNPITNIGFRITNFGFVSLKVYDVLGNEVATLVDEEKPAGIYEVAWNAENLSSGVYFYQLKAGNFTATKKLLLLR